MTAEESGKPSFTFQLSNESFSSRCKDVFANLESIEKKHEAYEHSRAGSKGAEGSALMKEDPVDDPDLTIVKKNDGAHPHRRYRERNERRSHHSGHWKKHDQRSDNTNRHGKDCDGFRQPLQQPPRRSAHTAPDYKKHPEKWTCYSLEDVKNGDMSEKSNQRAAFEFLSERRKAREQQYDDEKFEVGEAACSKGVISFSKHKASTGRLSQKEEHAMDSSTSSACISFEDMVDNENQIIAEQKLSFEEGNDKHSVRKTQQRSSDSNEHPLEEESKGSSENSLANVAPSFKARKTIRRNIRHKDSDDVNTT